MPKTVYLMRHAKSGWKHPLPDYERPLKKRGKRAARLIGKALATRGIRFDAVLSSTAVRARETARRVLEAMGGSPELIETDPGLYEADAQKILDRIRRLDRHIDTVLVVGHNPAISETAGLLSGESRFDWLPTAALVGIRFDGESWERIAPGKGEVILGHLEEPFSSIP